MPTTDLNTNLHNHVDYLTKIRPYRNHKNIKSLNQAVEYIETYFRKNNLSTERQTFKVDGNEYINVVATYGPADGERLIVGAHYDVCGDQPGADDNASAVAGLLEIARLLNEQKPNVKYRIDLVAYPLEEPPYFASENMGSAHHAAFLKKANIEVKGMICLEMIGYFSDKPNSQSFPDPALSKIYPNTGNFIIVVGKTGQELFSNKVKDLMKKNSSIDVQSINFPSPHGLAGLSDHRSYWKYNFPALMINDTAFLRNPHYHEKSDTIETLDFDKMAEVVKGAFAAVVGL
ncbi:MAG TPA: M28 family peptidase [Cytophagaceae bacterium]